MKKNKKSKENKFPILIFLLSIIMLLLGFYYEYVASPTRILKKALINITSNITDVMEMFEFQTGIPQSNTKTQTIKVSANTSNYKSNFDLQKYNKKLSNINFSTLTKNLNETNTTIKIITDTKNKKRLLKTDSYLGNKNLINTKTLIENSTEYYYDPTINPNYINLGNNTYFESVNDNTTTNDNLKYLHEYIVQEISTTLITKVQKEKEDDYNKIFVKLSNNDLNKTIDTVIDNLKKDKRASTILTSYKKYFTIDKKELKSSLKNVNIDFTVYVEKYTYKIKKYSINITNKEDDIEIIYQPDTKSSGSGSIEINNVKKYTYEYKETSKSKEVILYNETNSKIGEISLAKTNTGVLFDSNTLINGSELNINYIYNILNLKKKKSYDEEQQLIIRHSSKNQEILNLDLVINTKVEAKSRILENTKDAIIKSSLTEEKQTTLNDKYINLFNELNQKKE